MALTNPPQPIPHLEASPPPTKPEAKAPPTQVESPDLVEVSRLQTEFDTSKADLNRARNILKTAQAVKAGHPVRLNSPEYKLIAKRLQAGEPLDEIINKSATNVRNLHEASLDKELPYREAEASLLKSEVESSVTNQDIVRIINALAKHHAIRLDDPALAEVNRRKQLGETLTEIKARAQQLLDTIKRTSKMLRIAELMKHPQYARPLDLDIEATIRNRMQAGESLDDIIAKTRANLDNFAEVDRKKGQLAQTLKRIEEIKTEKQVIAGSKQKEQELAAQQQLSEIHQELKSITEKQYKDVNSFLVREFGIGKRQIQLLPEYSNAPKGETIEAKQLRIAQNMLEILKRKGALATSKGNREFFKKNCGLPDIAAPEVYLDYPAGATFLDPQKGEIKVYFNPGLQFFKADYQLFGVLEEVIHYSQLKQAGRNVVTERDEVDAKDRILGLANFVGFDKNRVEYLTKIRGAANTRVVD